MTDRAELVEKVARAIADYELPVGPGWQDRWRDYLGTADAAIAVVLEEAAKVAEGARTEAAGSEYQSGKPGDFWDRDSIYGCGREDAAAAIRKMIGKQDVHKT